MAFDPVTAIWAKTKATSDSKAYTDEVVKKLAGGLKYKGSVDTYTSLPISGNELGYMYTTTDTGHEWVWTIEATSGTLTDWLDLNKDLEKYYKKTEVDDLLAALKTELLATMETALASKQDKLTAGTNISITDENVISADKNAYNYINQIADYLFEVEYSTENIDYTYANKYFKDQPPVLNGACTGVYKDGRVLRHLDWYYNNEVEFLVRRTADPDNNIHASIGLATGVKGLTKSVVESGAYDRKFKMVPFLLTDGINDAGLYIQSNVVPALSNSYDINPEITAEDKQCCTTMLNRTILDRCASFAEVETLLNTYHIYGTSAIEFGSHFLIAQGTEWEIIELTHSGHFTVTQGTGENQMPNGIISNFRTTGLSFNNNAVDWNSIEEYGLGVERFDIATAAFTSDVSLEDLRNDLKFTKLYTELQQGSRWNTDYCGEVGTHGEKLKVLDAIDHEEYFDDVFTTNAANYQARTRADGKGTWQTTHSAIYDLTNKTLSFCIQERFNELFNFGLNIERNDNSIKQDTLIAGDNITIASDNKTISATDTKYTITIDL